MSYYHLSPGEKAYVIEILEKYHHRTGRKQQWDGSFGKVEITPKEFNDELAKAILRGKK